MATPAFPAESGLVAVSWPCLPFKRVLVPLDGSPLAERALPFARALAQLVQGDLILVRAAPSHHTYAAAIEAQLKETFEAEQYLARLARAYQADFAIETSVPQGQPADEIIRLAALRGADLVVMTTHGRSGLDRVLLGSVADAVIRRTQLPILLIRGNLPIRRWEHGLHSILVPLDGSEPAETALYKIVPLAERAGARVTLLQVLGPRLPELAAYDVVGLPDEGGAQAEQSQAYLSRLASGLHERGLQVQTEVLPGRPAERIGGLASSGQYDLIAMATHARRGLNRILVGSVADEVLQSAPTPLLLFRGA
jgi:nucleotide-binding universal stress UspA family protein